MILNEGGRERGENSEQETSRGAVERLFVEQQRSRYGLILSGAMR